MIEKYSAREVKMPEKKKCFIIMPITTPKTFLPMYREDKDHFEHVLDCLFIPALKKLNLKPIKPIAKGAELIHARIIKYIEISDLVLCDISTLNPSVFFELGVRSALNKPLCLVKDDITKKIPFDTTIINHHTYKSSLPSWEIPQEIDQLSKHIKDSIKTSKGINELWKYFGFSSIAYPAKEKGSVEDRLDYLTLKIESLKEDIQTRQRLPSGATGPHLANLEPAVWGSKWEDWINKVPQKLILDPQLEDWINKAPQKLVSDSQFADWNNKGPQKLFLDPQRPIEPDYGARTIIDNLNTNNIKKKAIDERKKKIKKK